MKTFLYVFRDDPERPIITDVEWAIFRFQARFDLIPKHILVNPCEAEQFRNVPLRVEEDSKIALGYFGVE